MSALHALSHTRYVLINRLATPAGAFIILIIIGRFSNVLLGQYALVMTFYYIMQMLPLLGLTPYVMREVARKPEQAGKFFVSIGALSMLGCVAVDIACAVFLHYVDYSSTVKHGIAIIGALIFPGILLFIAEIIFMSLHRAKPVAQVALSENTVRVIVSVIVLHFDGGLGALIWVFFATRLGATLSYVVIMRSQHVLSGFQVPDRAVLRATMKVLPGFFIGTLFFVVFSRMDFLILSLYQRVEVIGYYAVGYRLFDIGLVVLTALIMAVFPWVSRKFAGSQRQFKVAVRDLVLFLTAVLLFVAFAGVLLGEYYVKIFFARQYPHPVLLTQLFFVALFFCGMDFVTSSILHASDRQNWDTKAAAIGGIANIALLFGLIPVFGIYGAFTAKLASTLVQGFLKLFMVERVADLGWRVRDTLAIVLIIVSVTAVGYFSFDLPFLAKTAVILGTGIFGFPALFLLSGLFKPLRVVRFYWRPRHSGDVVSVADLADVLISDARRLHANRLTKPMLVLIASRMARFFSLRGRPGLSGGWAHLGKWITPAGIEFPALNCPMPARGSCISLPERDTGHT